MDSVTVMPATARALPSIASRGVDATAASPFDGGDWLLLACIVALAIVVRLTFFTGFFGSDEVTYVLYALDVVKGVWTNSGYIGALRLGMNYPLAGAVSVFGNSELSLALWGLTASVAEIAVVFVFARRAFGRELALVAAFLLLLLPMHVNLAGRILADAPLALFITLTFALLFEAERRSTPMFFVLAGLTAGLAFWVKEVTMMFVAVPLLWALLRRRHLRGYVLFLFAMTVVIAANFLAMWLLSGNPLHLIASMTGSLLRYADQARAGGAADDRSAVYYLRYLFTSPWHTWILGYLAAWGVFGSIRRFRGNSPDALRTAYVVLWGVGLLAVFSLFVVSVNPFNLIPKQANYMAIFLAPLCLLGALAIVRLRHSVTKGIILAVYAAGAIVLCGLEQETIRAFTANSRATLAFAARNPDSAIYVVTNAERLNMWVSMVSGADQEFAPNLRPMAGLFEPGGDSRGESHERLVVVDRQTLDWGRNALRSADDVPACWIRLGPLPAVPDRSAGHFMVQSLMQIAQRLPGAIAAAVSLRFERQMTPLPADVYRVPDGCS